MGWFLTNNTGGKKKKRKTGRGAKAPGWDPQRTLLGLKFLGAGVLAVALIVGWTATERVLGKYAADRRTADVRPDTIELTDAPSWMDTPMRERLREMVAHQLSNNPFDRAGLADAVRALDEDPWVAAVTQVRRGPHGKVEVAAEYRRPAAMVLWDPTPRKINGDEEYHLIDERSVWLDGPFKPAASRWNKLPVISRVSKRPPAAYGNSWVGSDIPAALRLHDLLKSEPYADQINEYDVLGNDKKGRLWITLHTDGPSILWGLAPGDERTVEPAAPVKLGALRDWAYSNGGRINARGDVGVVWVYTGVAQIDARLDTYSARR